MTSPTWAGPSPILVPSTDAAASLEAVGIDVHSGDRELAAARAVEGIAWFHDPFGFRHELSHGQRQATEPFEPGRPMDGFVTGDGGLGHAVLFVPDLAAAERFYIDVLGFRLSDAVEDGVSIRFLHCNSRHHSLAFVAVPGMVGMHHLMLEVGSLDDVGAAYDIVNERHIPLAMTLGRHTNDRMTSFYVRTPSGFEIEYGYGGALVDVSQPWEAVTYDSGSSWGHKPPAERLFPGIIRPAETERVSRVDTHHHVVPPEYAAWLRAKGALAGDLPIPSWQPEAALSLMDRHDVRTAVLSVSTPGVHLGDGADARAMARHVNEYAAQMTRDHPDRFGFFATMPLPDVDGALDEVAYAFDTLGADGVVLLANNRGTYLGDESFDPLFDELQRRAAVVFVHPSVPPGLDPIDGIPPFMADFLLDTTRAAVNLARSGTLERCPDVTVILSHAGGFIPYAAYRLARAASGRDDVAPRPLPPRALPLRHRPLGQSHRPAQLVGLRATRSRPLRERLALCPRRRRGRVHDHVRDLRPRGRRAHVDRPRRGRGPLPSPAP